MNGWDVQPTLDWAIARSSGRIVRNRLIVTPGPDPASPAAHLRALTVQTGQPVVVSTAACGGGPGGGPAHDGVRHTPRPWTGTDRGFADTPYLNIHITQRDSVARRALRRSAPDTTAQSAEPRVALPSCSILALKSRSVTSRADLTLAADSLLFHASPEVHHVDVAGSA
jgi:hypothetical protein